jgi:malate dehydrogenase
VVSLRTDTPGDDWHSVALVSDGVYNVPAGLISSFPTRCEGGKVSVVPDVPLDAFSRAKIDASVAELAQEREMVTELLA